MSSKKEIFLLLLSDLIFLNLAWVLYYYIRIESGWIIYANPPSFWIPMIVVYIFWTILFYFFGLYKHWFVRSRFEEFISLFRTITFGCLSVFFVIYLDDLLKNAQAVSRLLIIIYWIFLVIFVPLGRIVIRGFQIRLLKKGIGLRRTLIIGSGNKAKEVKEMIYDYPKLGYKFCGFIGTGDSEILNESGTIKDLPTILISENIEEVIIATEQKYQEIIIQTMNVCSDKDVSIKIVPEVYEIVSGMVKSEQVHGIPLVEIKTNLLPETSIILKRIFDFIFSFFILIIFSPIIFIIIIILYFTNSKKVYNTEFKVGRFGKIFKSYKFSIPDNFFGNLLRMFWVYDLPQFFNVLKNDMSIVGPEPECEEIVLKLKEEIPYYTRRLKVKPGITGWAKIKNKLYKEDEDFRKKLHYDFYYLENMSLLLDFKIFVNTFIYLLSLNRLKK